MDERGAEPEPGPFLAARGLSRDAVSRRVADGLANAVPSASSRTVWDIVRANVFTLFNAIVAGGFVVLLALGQWRDALFGLSAVANAVIGVVQEYRAKRSLDRLSVVASHRARVLREGTESEVDVADVVLDDVLVLGAGDQVPADGTVLQSAGLEVDESLLTGEADPVWKGPGTELLSGSSVLAGTGLIRASAVGGRSFAGRITVEAKRFALVSSEIRQGQDRVLRWITWALGPVLLVVINAQMQAAGGWETAIATGRWRTAAVGAIASAIAMIPLALVLVTSVAFAVGAARLARQGVLMQELAAVEGLARVDTLCVDKTGTLTLGTMSFDAVHGVGWDAPGWREALGWFASRPDANATARALLSSFPAASRNPITTVPFDSDRKWSAVQFDPHDGGAPRTWVLGAPDIVLGPEAASVLNLADDLISSGRRVVVLAATAARLTAGPPAAVALPPDLRPAALLTFREEIRPDARRTLEYFREQGVRVLVLSGDDPRTVGAVARQVGLDADDWIDARRLPEETDELARLVEGHSVFGRVTPAQKRRIVLTLQSRGRVVAMTGDGVNDVPALKAADLGIAMNSATAATKAVARLVLLDGRFDRLPHVVAEGRRVIANVERVSMLFLAKTAYAVLLSVVFGVLVWAFPFLPRQLSVSDGLTIGIPAFLLALMPNARVYRRGFLNRSLAFAVPAGVIVAAAVTAVHLLGRAAQPDELRTTALVTLCLAGLWILVVVSRPLDMAKLLTIATMYAALVVVLVVPALTEFLRLRLPRPPLLEAGIVAAVAAMVAIELLARVHRRWTTRGTPLRRTRTAEDGRGAGESDQRAAAWWKQRVTGRSALPVLGPPHYRPRMAEVTRAALQAPPLSTSGRRGWWIVYRRWTVAVVLGETAGFAIAAAAAVAAGGVPWAYPLIVLAGAAEGACLGMAQVFALRRSRLPLPVGGWVVATAAAAALAWAIGLLPSTLPAVDWANPLVLILAGIAGAALLLSIPVLQGLVLVRHGQRMRGWVAVNVLAWCVGIAWTFLPSPFIDETTPAPVLLAAYTGAGLLMALTVALITGLWVARIASDDAPGTRSSMSERATSGRGTSVG